MKTLLTLLGIIMAVSLQGQNEMISGSVEKKEIKVKQTNIIKIGTSVRIEPYFHQDIYYDPYYYNYNDEYDGGYNVPVFISYEHIWQYGDKVAFGIEPMAGVSFRKNLTGFFIGTEFRFYWANKGFWRIGISINPSYTYGTKETTRWVSMDDGNYQKLINVKLHYNIFSFDPGLIPFQFRIKNSPVIIESMISIIGLNVVNKTIGEIKTWEDKTTRFSSTAPYPYFLKYELKIGFVLP